MKKADNANNTIPRWRFSSVKKTAGTIANIMNICASRNLKIFLRNFQYSQSEFLNLLFIQTPFT